LYSKICRIPFFRKVKWNNYSRTQKVRDFGLEKKRKVGDFGLEKKRKVGDFGLEKKRKHTKDSGVRTQECKRHVHC
jgi:hypothetical protein